MTSWKRKSDKFNWNINSNNISLNDHTVGTLELAINGIAKKVTQWKQKSKFFRWVMISENFSLNETEKEGKPLSINSHK